MIEIGLVSFCCMMFIHLGLGDTISRIFHVDFVLLHCIKCLNFWSVLAYSLFIVELPLLNSIAIAFASSYAMLWCDLILAKIACRYDIWYKKIEKERDSSDEEE